MSPPSSRKSTPPTSPKAKEACIALTPDCEEPKVILSEDGTKKLIKTRCDECLKHFRKVKALTAFPKCAEMGKFTKKMEATEKLVKHILLRESKGELLTGKLLKYKARGLKRLDNGSAAGIRFNRVLSQRNQRFVKKNGGVDEEQLLAEKAGLIESDTEENFHVPPMPISKQEEMEDEDDEMTITPSKLEL